MSETLNSLMKHYNDREIVEALLTRDPREVNEATRQLYHQHHKMITHFVSTRGGSKLDAEDLFQDVVISFLHNVWSENFELRPSVKLSTYLVEIAKKQWLKKIRSRGNSGNREQAYLKDYTSLTPDDPDPLQTLITEEEDRWSLKIFQKLSADAQLLLKAFYLDKLSLKEIAAKLNYISDNAVKMQKHRIMRDLNNEIKKYKGL